jgi:hypothetical protein
MNTQTYSKIVSEIRALRHRIIVDCYGILVVYGAPDQQIFTPVYFIIDSESDAYDIIGEKYPELEITELGWDHPADTTTFARLFHKTDPPFQGHFTKMLYYE